MRRFHPKRTSSQNKSLKYSTLEKRALLAAIIEFDPTTNIVSVEGTDAADRVLINFIDGRNEIRVVTVDSTTRNRLQLQTSQISAFHFVGNDGDDQFWNNTDRPSVVDGGLGNDELFGGSGDDQFTGGAGNDRLSGRHGNDNLQGVSGNDVIYAGPGADLVDGGTGDDFLAGGIGTDTIFAGHGNDRVFGGTDRDVIEGSSGDDRIYSGSGDDIVNSGDGNDLIRGGSGNDEIDSGLGSDRVMADEGDDVIHGSEGADRIFGGIGDDVIYGDEDSDQLYGGIGDDEIYGGQDGDSLFGGLGDDEIYGEDGSDILYGGSGDDEIYGGEEDDLLVGSIGDDLLVGEDGNDTIYGENGTDILRGGNGNDGLFGGIGEVDRLEGGRGADRLLSTVDSNDRLEDLVLGWSSEDAIVRFENLSVHTVDITGLGNVTFTAQDWTNNEIKTIDEALEVLHEEVNSTALLKTHSGVALTFQRAGDLVGQSFEIGGWNQSGTIGLTNSAFRTELRALAVTYHEVGHNWDQIHENGLAREFQAISRWQNSSGAGLTLSTGGGAWHYDDGASGFAREYGRFNPFEDYATTWETYFTANHHDSNGWRGTDTVVAAKFENLDAFFEQVA